MKKGDYLKIILKTDRTVFSVKDIAILWKDANTDAARVRLNYYVKRGYLYRIRRGLYAKDTNYNKMELATKISTPSYISFETVLIKEGLIFQFQDSITVASYLSREITVDNQKYTLKRIKKQVLINNLGINISDSISIASKERAFLDILYINGDYHFDNTRSLDWDKVNLILPIYNNKRLEKLVRKLYKQK